MGICVIIKEVILEKILGISVLVLAITMVVIALPSQIKKNHKEKKCGLSFLMVILPLSVYLTRSFYAIKMESWYIFIPDSFGFIFSVVLLVQFFYYKK